MGRKKRKKSLALYQSKKKRKQRHFLMKSKNTDDISTEEFSNHSEHNTHFERNEIVPSTSNNDLDEIFILLDRFSDLLKSFVESIETE